MNSISTWLTLVRWRNILIAVMTAMIAYIFLIRQVLYRFEIAPELSLGGMVLLLFCLALVMAGGYMINDLSDTGTDAVNRPDRQELLALIGRRRLFRVLVILLVAGTLLSLLLSWSQGRLWLAILYPGAWLLLFAYSQYLKGSPLWGNLLVAVLCAAVPWLMWLSEQPALAQLQSHFPTVHADLYRIFTALSVFAFLSTLIREIVKDLEDMEGDTAQGLRTLPLRYGEKNARMVVAACVLLFIILLLFWTYRMIVWFTPLNVLGTLAPIAGILFWINLRIISANAGKASYTAISSAIKSLMLLGLLHFFLIAQSI